MTSRLILITLFVSLLATQLKAQTKPSTYVDKKGVLRWTADKHEVTEFGVHYALPFSIAFESFKQLGLSFDQGVEQDIYHLTRLGLKAYRIHVWDTEVSDTAGNLVENEHLRVLDYTIKTMKDRGFKIVLTPLTFYGTRGEDAGFGQEYGKQGCFIPEAVGKTEKYLTQFVSHVNRYTNIAYKDDPDIIAFELYNEAEHTNQTEEEAKTYVNQLVAAVRQTGCQKPLFHCITVAPNLRQGLLDADIQGASSQWYPTSMGGGFDFKGNMLTQMDHWPARKDSVINDAKAKNKALLIYELDAADNSYGYTYPLMSRTLRSVGFQFASMFSYDPLGIAYSNVDFGPFLMNMAYTPQKAMGLKIAAEVFHKIPRGKKYQLFPADTVFDGFHVSHMENLAELVSEDKFMYSNNTISTPPAPSRLKEIAGYGSSPVVTYSGRGIYFLDKLDNGVWRLEVMPDATWVDDPFGRPSLSKEMFAIVWNTWPLTINLSDLGSGFTMTGINEGNTTNQTATGNQISVSPGTYLLVKKGVESKWKPNDKWKDITLKEFVAPKATTNTFVVHTPVEEISKGSLLSIDIEVISSDEPESVNLILSSLNPGWSWPNVIPFKKTSRYGYSATIPQEILDQEVLWNYQITVKTHDETKQYPEDAMYLLRIVDSKTPVNLLDVATDYSHMRRSHRFFPWRFHPSAVPGKMGIELGMDNMRYASFFFADRVASRQSDMASKSKVILHGSALSDQLVKIWVVLQSRNGFEYGSLVTLKSGQWDYSLPLSGFSQIRIFGPGEKGFMYVNPFEGVGKGTPLKVSEAETIKLIVLSKDNQGKVPARGVVEYVNIE